jgi:protocatechuate 3,4-dioxygenase beta subunit
MFALVDEQKGYSFMGVTEKDGRYSFRSVPPGTYARSVMAKGFQTQQKREIRVAVSQNVSIGISLTVGARRPSK